MRARYQRQSIRSETKCDILLAVDAYMPWSGGSRLNCVLVKLPVPAKR